MAGSCFAFDVDDCLEIGGQQQLPSTSGPVTIASIRAQVANGDVCGVVGNWTNLPSILPDWREVFSFLLPPSPHNSSKAFWLAWVRNQYPGCQHYVMVGNDPHGHHNRPAYWERDWPGTLPVQHVGGDHLLSEDIDAAAKAGFEFIKEDAWAAGSRIGVVPPRQPQEPFYQFPKHARPPMLLKTFAAPEILKSDDAKGIVEAIVSVTANKDLQGDVIDPGAWKAALDSGIMPRITADHRWSVQSNLGRTLAAEEWMPGDPRLPQTLRDKGYGGLWVRGQFNMDKQLARETYSDLKGGFVNEFSVGFDVDVIDGKKCEGEGDGANHIKSIRPWYEWSVVFMGANPETRPVSLKSAETGEMTAEEFLCLSDDAILDMYYETLGLPDDQLTLKAKWSRAFINRLPDSAFALVLPGGTKDSTGRTAPRSLRKLPHHGPGGAVDKPHLSNALSRAAQQPALKAAIPHLRKHANAIGMGKALTADDYTPDTLDPAHVTEALLQHLGVTVGATVAATIAARRTNSI